MSSAAPMIESLLAQAAQQINAGELASAEASCREALALEPSNQAARTVLGAIVLAQGRFGEAEAAFLELTTAEPGEPTHWTSLGLARRGLGQFDDALKAFSAAAARGANGVDFHLNLGLTHLDRGDVESARAVLSSARAQAPDDAEVALWYAQACYRGLHNDEAAMALSGWQAFRSPTAGDLAQIGQLLVNLGHQDSGLAALEVALGDPSADSVTLLTGAEVFERVNRLDEARALVDRLDSGAAPTSMDDHILVVRARLAQRAGDNGEAERLYSQAVLSTSDTAQKHVQLFPLARVLDSQGRYEEAWQTLQQAHASQYEYLRRVQPALALLGAPPMAITARGCDAEDVAAWRDDAPGVEESPVFVVAFPRSGTTLLELMLDAHPQLQSMDERSFIQDALADLGNTGVDYPAGLRTLTQAQLDGARSNYWRRVAGVVTLRSDARLVDKNPLNILRLPVIRRLFPNAPVILALRHPLDVILSCYMQHFRSPEFALLCNRLDTLSKGYARSMDFWTRESAILGGKNVEVRYEALVSDAGQEARRLLAALDLPWHDAVLRPADRAREKGYISTPSYAQVVAPVSSAPVGRWQHYAEHLAPVIPVVQGALGRWGYSAILTDAGVSPNKR